MSRLYAGLFRHVLYPLYEQGISRRQTLTYLREYQQHLHGDLSQLRAIQADKLQRLLQHAYQAVPYYRQQWDALGIRPQDIRQASDLAQLPVLTKDLIREHYDQLIAVNHPGQTIKKTTGGSTGQPFRFELDAQSNERRQAVMFRGYGWLGAGLGVKATYLWGASIGEVSRSKRYKEALYHRFYHRKMLNTFTLTEHNYHEYIEQINRHRAQVLVCYVNPVVQLAQYIIDQGIQVHRPQAILTGAEPLYEFQRRLIEQAFAAPVYNTYGCREFMLIAAECKRQNRLHINIDHLVVETLDDQQQPTVEVGDLVITDLHNYAMPLIRYVNGDQGQLSPSVCPCGNPLPLLEQISGRRLDMIVTPGGRRLPGEFFPHLFKDYTFIKQFQVVQSTRDSLDIFWVTAADSAQQVDALVQALHRQIGEPMQIRVHTVDNIALTASGKHRVVVSQLPQHPGEAAR